MPRPSNSLTPPATHGMKTSVSPDFLLRQPEWAIFVGLLLVLFAASEVGWGLGRRDRRDTDESAPSQIGAIEGAVLGFLALLLGFTFSMAAQRFDARRALVLAESNAIGTADLRAELVGEPERKSLEELLRRYVDVRLAFYRAGIDDVKQHAANADIERLQGELWRTVRIVAEREPQPKTSLSITAMNDVIDLHSTRVAALNDHVPSVILGPLLVVGVLGASLTGYGDRVRQQATLGSDRDRARARLGRHLGDHRSRPPATWIHSKWAAKHGSTSSGV